MGEGCEGEVEWKDCWGKKMARRADEMHGLGVVEDGSWWMEERKANVRRGFVTGGEEKDGCWAGLGAGSWWSRYLPGPKRREKVQYIDSCCDWLAALGLGLPTCVCWLSCPAGLASLSLSPLTGGLCWSDRRAACETKLQRAPAAVLLPPAPDGYLFPVSYRYLP